MRSLKYSAHNHLTILQNGGEYFPALLKAIEAASEEIYFETYIFALDDVGHAVKDALKRAASRGVEVHVITDWLGTGHVVGSRLESELLAAGVYHRSFNPWFRRGIARTHRKICVVDGKVAFVGGINITDDLRYDYDPKQRLPAPRWDFAIRVEGTLVAQIHRETESEWARQGKLHLLSRLVLMRDELVASHRVVGRDGLAGFVVRDNLHNRRTIQRAYLRAIGHAKQSVVMANPYFAPGSKFRNALAAAAARGVEVTLLLGVGEFWLQDSVAQSMYPKMLKRGIRLYEYRKTQLHGKVAVVDNIWATVGSSNIDGLSLFLNHEANVVVRDAAFVKDLRAHITAAIAEAAPISLDDFDNRPWYKRLGYNLAYMFYRMLMRIVTLGDYT
ncbi:MAG: cardiolipin synthase ClsB [Burkholderiaceae bacterium]|nr:cardiolipin synthase ClsB [Burkholderiaceae bacterium]